MKRLLGLVLIVLVAAAVYYFRGLYKLGQLDGAVVMVRELVDAEVRFARSHPTKGYTCNLSDLSSELSEDGQFEKASVTKLLDSSHWNGYSFEIRGCQGTASKGPNLTYEIVARPTHGGQKVCADQSRVLRLYDTKCDQE
jgi:hypothetical protein